jgi:hypothetical protein
MKQFKNQTEIIKKSISENGYAQTEVDLLDLIGCDKLVGYLLGTNETWLTLSNKAINNMIGIGVIWKSSARLNPTLEIDMLKRFLKLTKLQLKDSQMFGRRVITITEMERAILFFKSENPVSYSRMRKLKESIATYFFKDTKNQVFLSNCRDSISNLKFRLTNS